MADLQHQREKTNMGFMQVQCKCGCGKQVPRGSDYFLQQGLGLKFGLEAIDVYHDAYLSKLAKLVEGTDSAIDMKTFTAMRFRCVQMSDYMLSAAHGGSAGLRVSRLEVEEVNRFVVTVILMLESVNPVEYAKLNVTKRMSRPQKMLFETIKRRMNS
jgi:hypothetical protein